MAVPRGPAVTTNGARDVTTTRIPLGIFARKARDLVRRARAECKNSDDASAIFVDPRTDEATIEGRFTIGGAGNPITDPHTIFASDLWRGRSTWSVGNVAVAVGDEVEVVTKAPGVGGRFRAVVLSWRASSSSQGPDSGGAATYRMRLLEVQRANALGLSEATPVRRCSTCRRTW